jgi:hypothetical protein
MTKMVKSKNVIIKKGSVSSTGLTASMKTKPGATINMEKIEKSLGVMGKDGMTILENYDMKNFRRDFL